VGLTASTIEVGDDNDSGHSGGHCGQCPPPSLKRMSMEGPFGDAASGSNNVHHQV
jgi:hypothetical protein